MRGSFRRGLALLAGLVAIIPPAARSGEVSASAGGGARRYEALVLAGDRVFCVGQRFLRAGSDSVSLAGRPLRPGIDYTLDADEGCLLLNAVAFTDSTPLPAPLVMTYRLLDLGLKPLYAHRDLRTASVAVVPGPGGAAAREEADGATTGGTPGGGPVTSGAGPGGRGAAGPVGGAPPDTSGRMFPVRPATEAPGDEHGRPELDLTGSKTFTVEVGSNRDLSLRQTLDLRVNGTVSRDVTLKAILSDRNLPFQPEGNTAELEELDRILIEVEGPGAKVGLGDQDIAVDGGSLGTFSRRLQGLTAEVGRGGGRALLVGASQRGEFRSLEFLGTEGKQGPYALSDRAGGRGIVVVAGSERVWLDGVELARGLDRDYTIDYGRAELSFTPRRVITAQSRIAVDYEFSAVGYRRSLYLASGRSRAGDGPLQLSFEIAREGDDNERPLSGELTPAERARLAQAGDSLVTGGSGVRLVGDGLGRYLLAYDAAASRSYYRYVGPGQGNYEITFIRIGPGLGDYTDSTTVAGSVYVYRGPNGGAWAPQGGLTAPVSHDTGHLAARLGLGERAEVSGEFAVSRLDRNTLSALEDDDNNGAAGRLDLKANALPLRLGGRSLGVMDLGGELRNLGRNFSSLGRIDNSFTYDRDWNLPSRGSPLSELRRGASAAWRPRPGWVIATELGGISGSGRSSDRRIHRFERQGRTFGSATLLRVDSGVDSTRFDGRLERDAVRAGTRIGPVAPAFFFEREERVAPESGVGGRYELGGGDITFGAFGPLTLTLGADTRNTDSRGADSLSWGRLSHAVTRRGSITLAGPGSLTASGTWQARDVTRPGTGKSRSDLATLDLSNRTAGSALVTELHYRLATTGVETRTRTLTFVGEGKGDYDALGNLFPGGGYQMEEGPLGPEQLVTDLDLTLRVELDPYRASSQGRGWWATLGRNLGWNGTFRLEEQSRLPLGRLSYLFKPSSYQRPESTLHGRLQVRQALEILPQNRGLNVRVEETLDDVASYQYVNYLEDRTEHIVGITLLGQPTRLWSGEVEQRVGRRSQGVVVSGNPSATRRADVLETRGLLAFRAAASTRASLEATWRREDAGDNGRGEALDLSPRLTHTVGNRGRAGFTARWVVASREGGYTGVGGFSSLSLQDRVEAGLDGDYQIRRTVTISGGVSGRRYEGSSTVIDGRMEVRAHF